MMEIKACKRVPFYGAAAAVITPFSDGEVDFLSLGRVIDHLMSGGVDAIAVCGTTGEAPALTVEEYRSIVKFSCEHVHGRAPVIAGAGGSTTDRAAGLAEIAGECGAAAVLSVTPYYNKASREGLCRHYAEIARVGLPVILYNVPSRTGVDIPIEVYRVLSEVENIVGIKEASGDARTAMRLLCEFRDRFALYCGCDELNLPLAAAGFDGFISVTANVRPREVSELWRACRDGRLDAAREIDRGLAPLTRTLFCEVNPIPVKAVMSKMGLCRNELRLPLTPMKLPDDFGER